MIGIDTNVLVRAIAEKDDQPAARCARDELRRLTPEEPGFITQVVIAELHWVLRRRYGFDRTSCLSVIRGLIESEALEFDDGEGVVRALTLAEAGADFTDGLIQGANELFGIVETVTLDRKAARRLGWRLLDDSQTSN
jgi:predicted nucleic-acid-binding protein